MTFLIIYFFINAFILGSLFGSFYSLATYRLPRKQDIFITNSYCPVCKHNLGFLDLFPPVFNYIFQGGKCRYCKCHIHPRYIMLETFSGILFTIMFGVFYYLVGFGYSLKTLYAMIIFIIIYTAIVLTIGSRIEGKKYEREQKAE